MERAYATDDDPKPALRAQLRRLVHASLAQCDPYTAAWYCDKLVSLDQSCEADMLLFARVLHAGGEHLRALHVLERHKLLSPQTFANPSRRTRIRAAGAALPLLSQQARDVMLDADASSPAEAGGVVTPAGAPFFLLGASCYRALSQWEKCASLLESAMEGPAQPPLWVPLGHISASSAESINAGVDTISVDETPLHELLHESRAMGSAQSGGSAVGAAGAPPSPAVALSQRSDTFYTWNVLRVMAWRQQEFARLSASSTSFSDSASGGGLSTAAFTEPFSVSGSRCVPLSDGSYINTVASMCALRGEALLQLDNRSRAAQWFLAAVRLDPYCAGAASALVDHHLLNEEQEALLQSLLSEMLLIPLGIAAAAGEEVASAQANGGAQRAQQRGGDADAALSQGNSAMLVDPTPGDAAAPASSRARPRSRAATASSVSSLSSAAFQPFTTTTSSTAVGGAGGSSGAAAQSAACSSPSSSSPSSSSSRTRRPGATRPTSSSSSSGVGGTGQQPLPPLRRAESATALGAGGTPSSVSDVRGGSGWSPNTQTSSSSSSSSSSAATARGGAMGPSSGPPLAGSPSSSVLPATSTSSSFPPLSRVASPLSRTRSSRSVRDRAVNGTNSSSTLGGGGGGSSGAVPGRGGSLSTAVRGAAAAGTSPSVVPSSRTAAASSTASKSAVVFGSTTLSTSAAPSPTRGHATGSRAATAVSAASAAATAAMDVDAFDELQGMASDDEQNRAMAHPHQQDGTTAPVAAAAGRPRLPLQDCSWLLDLHNARLGRYTRAADASRSMLKFRPLESRWGLGENVDVLFAKAEVLFYQHDLSSSLTVVKRALSADAHHRRSATLQYALLVSLRRSSELFRLAHVAVDTAPRDPLSWYATGCYYLSVGKPVEAIDAFTKTTRLDITFAPAWLGLGQAFTLQDATESALAAYRGAMKLWPNCHIPPLAMATLSVKLGQVSLARQYLALAQAICSTDPLLYHELGVLEFRLGNNVAALLHLRTAAAQIEVLPFSSRVVWEPTLLALGHVYRKLGQFDRAVSTYSECLRLAPRNATTLCALGFTLQLSRNTSLAIEMYHAALATSPDDSISQRLLATAMADEVHAASRLLQADVAARTRGNALDLGRSGASAVRGGSTKLGDAAGVDSTPLVKLNELWTSRSVKRHSEGDADATKSDRTLSNALNFTGTPAHWPQQQQPSLNSSMSMAEQYWPLDHIHASAAGGGGGGADSGLFFEADSIIADAAAATVGGFMMNLGMHSTSGAAAGAPDGNDDSGMSVSVDG